MSEEDARLVAEVRAGLRGYVESELRWVASRLADRLESARGSALSEAAAIADEYAREAKEQRDDSDYPESWIGMQYHGQYHGAQDVAIRIRRALAESDSWEDNVTHFGWVGPIPARPADKN